jgi:hypothetical protein
MNFSSGLQQESFCRAGRNTSGLALQSLIRTAPLAGSYPVSVSEGKREEKRETRRPGVGLCADCRFMRRIESDRGSTFYLCERSATDANFPKYPRLPVLQCAGYERLSADLERG